MAPLPLSDPADTRVTTLELTDNPNLPVELAHKCADAATLGYQLSACFPNLDRLVLIFQKPLPVDRV